MLSKEEKKAIERIEDFLTTNIIISISSDETADSEELNAFISKNEFKSIELISSMFLKQSKEIERLEAKKYMYNAETGEISQIPLNDNYIHKDKIKAKIEEIEKRRLQDGECELALHGFQREAKIEVLQSLLEKE